MLKNSTSVDLYLNALHLIGEDIGSSCHDTGYFTRRICPDAPVAVYARKHQPDGRQGIVFEVTPSIIKPLRLSHVSRGFVVSTELDVSTAGKNICRVAITIGASAFAELFAELVGYLLDHVIAASTEKDAMTSLQSQLMLWRKFLDRDADDGLSDEQQSGLFGELRFMKMCITKGVPTFDLLNAWKGPTGSNQDFAFGSCSIEIKTSTSNEASHIRISNPRQLDNSGLSKLYLYHYAFDRRQASGETLPQLVNWLIDSISSENPSLVVLFEERLLAVGYLRIQQSRYSETGYQVRYESGYIVDERFPRLLESDLAPGVSDVKYVVELACANNLKVNAEDIVTELGYHNK